MLGLAPFPLQLTPKPVSVLNDRRIVSMAAGDQFSVVLDHFGEVWVWGRGETGQVFEYLFINFIFYLSANICD